jgi:hypothetical protein
MQFDKGLESRVDLAFGAGLKNMELHPLARAASCRFSINRSGIELLGFTSRAITRAWGTSSESSSSLRHSSPAADNTGRI